jgi:hypothetical protein
MNQLMALVPVRMSHSAERGIRSFVTESDLSTMKCATLVPELVVTSLAADCLVCFLDRRDVYAFL